MENNRENLISLVKQHPCLWDPNDDDHRNLKKRDDAVNAIGNSFAEVKSKEAVLREWNSIKIYYQSRVRDMLRRRAKTSIEKKPKWEHFDQIHEFLGPHTLLTVRQAEKMPIQAQQNSSNSTEEKFNDFFGDYNDEEMDSSHINAAAVMNSNNTAMNTSSFNNVAESFAAANGNFGAKMIVMSKQNVDEDIDSFLNSIRPTLKKLAVNEEVFEDAKFEINSLLHKKYKECRDQLKEGFQLF